MSSTTTSYPDLAAMVPLTKVEPFSLSAQNECPACGSKLRPLAHFMATLRVGTIMINDIAYCRGGKAATEECGPGGVIGQLVGRHEHVNLCAGHAGPHLHVTCRRCGFRRLMETATPVKGGLL